MLLTVYLWIYCVFVCRHLLQILLHFESLKLCSSIEIEAKMAAANTVSQDIVELTKIN